VEDALVPSLGPSRSTQFPIRRTLALQLMHPMLSVLVTGAMLIPQNLDQPTQQYAGGEIFDVLMGQGN